MALGATRRQTTCIIWTNDGKCTGAYMRHSALLSQYSRRVLKCVDRYQMQKTMLLKLR